MLYKKDKLESTGIATSKENSTKSHNSSASPSATASDISNEETTKGSSGQTFDVDEQNQVLNPLNQDTFVNYS